MIQNCAYNPSVDIEEVVPELDTDIAMAIETGVVSNTGEAPSYNDISTTSAIRGRVSDVFEAIDAQRGILDRASRSAAAASSGASSAASAASSESSTSNGKAE